MVNIILLHTRCNTVTPSGHIRHRLLKAVQLQGVRIDNDVYNLLLLFLFLNRSILQTHLDMYFI